MAFSSSNRNSASARAVSVLPTPVGPRKMNEPMGRLGSCSPLRDRRTALATAWTASFCPTTRCSSRSSIRTSFSRSPSSIRATGMPVQAATTLAMSSSETSCASRRWPWGFSCSVFSAAASFFCSSGRRPYWIWAARFKSLRRWACSSSSFVCSIWLLIMLTALMAAFSFCHWAFNCRDCSLKLARSCSSFWSRSREASSFSFRSAFCSISSCWIWRSNWSISVGRESSSMRSREAASSIRSIALSGRKRSAM